MHTFLSFKRLSPIGAAVLILIMVVMLYPMLPPDPQPAHAATTRYASPLGSGTACTSSAPCSLQTAINQAVAGDTVIAMNGTYNTTRANYITINGNNGTVSAPITLVAQNRHQAFIQGPSGCISGGNVDALEVNTTWTTLISGTLSADTSQKDMITQTGVPGVAELKM